MQSAILITTETSHGYGHVFVNVGTIDHDEKPPKFRFSAPECERWADTWNALLSCQLGHSSYSDAWARTNCRTPYAVEFRIDPNGGYDGIPLHRMPELAKAATKLERALARVAAKISSPITFDDHALHLFLATRAELLITRKGADWREADHWETATADGVRQAVRRAVREVTGKLYPEAQEGVA
jgi:hypothetical protein